MKLTKNVVILKSGTSAWALKCRAINLIFRKTGTDIILIFYLELGQQVK